MRKINKVIIHSSATYSYMNIGASEIEKLEIEFRTQLRWIIGIVVMMIFANFFYQSITNNGFLLNIDTPIEALHVIILLGAVKVVMGISIAELIKLYNNLFKQKELK